MNSELLCQPHCEQAKYLGKDIKSNQLIGFCLKCVPNAKVPLMLIDDVQKDIEENKTKLMKVITQEKEENTNILNNLLVFLNQFKIEQIRKLDDLIKIISEVLAFVKKSFNNKSDLFIRLGTLDLDNLIDNFQTKGREQDLEKKKQVILAQLADLQSTTFFYESSIILSQFPSQKSFWVFKATNESNSQGLKCSKHSYDIIGLDVKEQNYNEILLCIRCLSDKPRQIMSIDDAKKEWNNHHQKFREAHIQYKRLLEQTAKVLKNHLSKNFEKIKEKHEHAKMQLENLVNSKANLIQQQIDVFNNKQLNLFSQTDLKQLMEISSSSTTIFLLLQEEIQEVDNFLKTQIQSQSKNINLKKLFQLNGLVHKLLSGNYFDYTLYKNSTYICEYKNQPKSLIKQKGYCSSIAVNNDGNLLVVECDNKIYIYEVNLGTLKLLQQLENVDMIFCLQFIKNQNNFVSGGQDKQIKLWIQLQGRWSLNQILQGHSDWIHCLAINSKGDQIISGSCDKSVRIWSLQNRIWSHTQTISDHKNLVYSLSLNESENQLISCDKDGLVLVMGLTNGKQWTVFQQIQLELGYRLCFITNNQFTFQSARSQLLQIFEFDLNKKQFVKTKVIQMKDDNKYQLCSGLSPQQFIKSKQLLVNKFKNYLNIIKKLENGEFKVEQSILMNSNVFYGTMSNNGEYLFISEFHSKEIKVYKYDEIKITEQLL